MNIEKLILLLKKNPSGLDLNELRIKLNLKRSEFRNLIDELRRLHKQGLVKTQQRKVVLASPRGLVRGRFVTTRPGFGFVIPEDGSEDVFIPACHAKEVMQGDEVEVLVNEKGRSKKPEGKIARIIKMTNATFIGEYTEKDGQPFLRAFDNPSYDEIAIKVTGQKRLKPGLLVEVSREDKKLVKIFGFPDDPGADTQVIIRRFNLGQHFSQTVQQEAAGIPGVISPRALRKRADFRNWTTVTIDGENAQDFDDALSIKQIRPGRFLLGVHIADVSHFVKEESALDREAYERGTSVYFPDTTLPMLPEKLSNDLCSLKPSVDRLTISVLMEVDRKGAVLKTSFMPSVIKTKARLTYNTVYKIFQGSLKERVPYQNIVPDLLLMRELAGYFRACRLEEGSLDFDLVEPELIYKQGLLKDVVAAERNEAHRLVEEFMLAANVAVAAFLSKKNIPMIYRIHPYPSASDLERLRLLLDKFGYNLPEIDKLGPQDLQRVLTRVKGRPEEKFVAIQVLRAMKLATYSLKNEGHFGLAKKEYTHFTSPIRRYPDLVVHRLLKAILAGEKPKANLVEGVAEHCTEKERNASAAEQTLLEWRIFRLLKQRLGDEFMGTVVDVNKTGLMVELDDYFVTGILPFETLGNGARRKKTGQRPKKYQPKQDIFSLGDKIRVQLVSCDPGFQKMTLVLSDSDNKRRS